MISAICIISSIINCVSANNAEFLRIGGLFDRNDLVRRSAFEYAVDMVNAENILPQNKFMVAISKEVKPGDSFSASIEVCNLLAEGAIAIFGPPSAAEANYVRSVCESKDVPHIETRIDSNKETGNCHINFYPHYKSLSKAYIDVIQMWEWKRFTILYENSNNLIRISELLKLYDSNEYIITVRQLDLGVGNNYRPIFHLLKAAEEKNFIIDCSIEILYDVLLQAQQIGLMSNEHGYIITNLDMHTLDLEPFQYGGANITGFRILDPKDEDLIEMTNYWNNMQEKQGIPETERMTPNIFTTEAALIIDAVYTFATVLQDLNFDNYTSHVFDCKDNFAWVHGSTVANYMKMKHIEGYTGDIKFDYDGHRNDFTMDVITVAGDGITKIGTWNPTNNIRLSNHSLLNQIPFDEGVLINRTFIVLTALSDPYGMLKDSTLNLEGNDRFEGFGIELIQEVSKMLGFNYTFVLQEDGNYGSVDRATGEWNGMMKELLDFNADLAITDLTITSDRERAFDFTMPFMNVGISILYKRPTKQPPSLFSFMSPFSKQVWLCLGTAYLGVSILLYFMARISPKEWQNPYPCIQEPEQLENQFSMANSLWFTVGSMLQQGSEIAPMAISTRMTASVWFFFTLIMVSSYTANLAAFLTVESLTSPISSAKDLADNTQHISYGAKKGGATFGFFKDSDDPIYKKMYEYMDTHPEAMTASNNDGVIRVQSENYAFLMESTSIEYIIERKCDITQVNGLLDEKGYGIAMRKNSPYRGALSGAVLHLQETGVLQAMKRKWWKEKRGGGACAGAVEASSGSVALTFANVGGVFVVLFLGCVGAALMTTSEMLLQVWTVAREEKDTSGDSGKGLGIANVGGVFFVLICGCICSFGLAVGELILGALRGSFRHKVPFKHELMEELKFVLKGSGETKPVRHRSSESKSPEERSQRSESNKSKDLLKPPVYTVKLNTNEKI